MSDVDAIIVAPLEKAMLMLPLGGYPVGRAFWGAAMGGAVMHYVRPSVAFEPDGTPKPWIVMDPDNPEAAIFPWWAFVVMPAVFFGVFL